MSHSNADRKPQTLFFAGTDTDAGKTFTAALVAKVYREEFGDSRDARIGVYKPVASGCRVENDGLVADDAVELWHAAGQPRSLEDVCPQRFAAALAPTQAARLEGKKVDPELLREGARCWEADYDLLIVEGAGGLMSPLADGVLNVDLIKRFDGAKLVIVAANRLGVIHQTLATCAAAKGAGVKPAGIILCQVDSVPDSSVDHNASEISEYTDVPVLGTVGFGAATKDVCFLHHWLAEGRRNHNK